MNFEKEFSVGDRTIGDGHPPYVIGEIGSNHNQDLNEARELIHAASEAGADAVKFQSLQFDELYREERTDEEFRDFFETIELSEDWYGPLAETCAQADVHFLSSPTYPRAIQLLNEQGVPAFKLASAQVGTSDRMIREVFGQGKPVFVSTGLSDRERVNRVSNLAIDEGNPELVLLHCVSMYPAPAERLNLRMLQSFRREFDCLVGFSDHTLGDHAAVAAVSLGASVIEKHITFDRDQDGPDHHFSQEIPEFEAMVRKIHETYDALGDGDHWALHPEEEEFLEDIRMGCVIKRDLASGETVGREDLEFYRLDEGIDANRMDEVVGQRVTRNLDAGDVLRWEDIDRAE